ncbi:CCR4-associated factor 1-related protein [Carex littledalei]|uniref:poly(A)-specific ribonuclease n=1 Tax=Carex littledalei TaxID=544730 RepID=A0A833QWE6_9POAL|nr:CCR4-associated factor 1-related protein [Carex littledalei]
MALHQARRSRAAQMRPVFEHNLAMEFAIINQVADSYRYVTIDTEFPGLVYQTKAHPRNLSAEQRYSLVKANVDNLKLIQLGITLSNRDSDDSMTWEFNFRGFDPEIDSQDPSSIELLKLQGIDFLKNKTEVIIVIGPEIKDI